MNQQDRLNNIENKTNLLFNEINMIKNNYNMINTELTKVKNDLNDLKQIGPKLDIIIENFEKHNPENCIKNQFGDKNGKLNNNKNPFIIEAKKFERANKLNEDLNKINLDKSLSSSNSNVSYKIGKYKQGELLYFYYDIGEHTYRYTCENKYAKYKLKFKCSDTKILNKYIFY